METNSLLSHEPAEEEVALFIEAIFESCPLLYGFSVQGTGSLPEEFQIAELNNALIVAEVGVDPVVGSAYCNRVSDEIAAALLHLVKLRPEAAALLRDRTFARVLQ